jgi:hypothetical protein
MSTETNKKPTQNKKSGQTIHPRVSDETYEKIKQIADISNRPLGNLFDEIFKEVEVKKY